MKRADEGSSASELTISRSDKSPCESSPNRQSSKKNFSPSSELSFRTPWTGFSDSRSVISSSERISRFVGEIDLEDGYELVFPDVESSQSVAAGLVNVDAEANRTQLSNMSSRVGIAIVFDYRGDDLISGTEVAWGGSGLGVALMI